MAGSRDFISRRRDSLGVRVFAITTFSLLFLGVVLPNSLQTATAVVMAVCFIMALPIMKVTPQLARVFWMYLLGVIVTLIYLMVGLNNGAPEVAAGQVIIIYIVSPLLWLVICSALARAVSSEQLIQWFVVLAILSCLSVALYFVLYLRFGARAVSFFKDQGNLDVQGGYAGATMFVYGSLIFLTGAFFAAPEVVKNRPLRFALLGGLFVCALTSGRAALIMAMPLGLLWALLFTRQLRVRELGKKGRRILRNVLLVLIATALFGFLLVHFTQVALSVVVGRFFDEVLAGGGAARSEQASALWSGILQSSGMGSGHGVGVSYVRSDQFPWRYELVWVATVFRVGFLGALFYLLPFLYYIISAVHAARSRAFTLQDHFLFAGFLCAFVASGTNPYIESFAFQWMYVLPVVWLFSKVRAQEPTAVWRSIES